MPSNLVVEDGSMPKGANCYASIATCDSWLAARGSTAWPAADDGAEDPNKTAKEAAIILAADYLNGLKWKGKRAASGRIMAWPRVEVVDGDGYAVPDNIVPEGVIAANCYLAEVAYDAPDALQPVLERGGRIQSEKVGTLQTTYFEDARNRDVYTVLSDLLGGLAVNIGGEQGSAGASGMSVVEVGRG